MNSDLYVILGVSKNASEDEIKRAYRKEALKWHPDKNADRKEEAESRFKKLSEAYEVLKDPRSRSVYDRYGMQGLNGGGSARSNSFEREFSFHSPFDIFAQVFGHDPFSFDNDPFNSDPFFSNRNARHPASSFFGGGFDPFSSSSFMSTSSSSISGFGGQSRSQQTVIRNGQRKTITTVRDAQGNTTIETETQDASGNISKERTVNGVPQQLVDDGSNQQRRISGWNQRSSNGRYD